jgi:hypothetical protein
LLALFLTALAIFVTLEKDAECFGSKYVFDKIPLELDADLFVFFLGIADLNKEAKPEKSFAS